MASPRINAAEALADALRAAQCSQPETVPKGWQTMRELSKLTGYSRAETTRRLKKTPHECRTFRVQCGRQVYPVPHYRLTNSPAPQPERNPCHTCPVNVL